LVAVKSSALPQIVQLLLERGADATVKDENGKTPLEIAQDRKLTDVVNLLEIHGTHK
jgi:ankyrin repeat protein